MGDLMRFGAYKTSRITVTMRFGSGSRANARVRTSRPPATSAVNAPQCATLRRVTGAAGGAALACIARTSGAAARPPIVMPVSRSSARRVSLCIMRASTSRVDSTGRVPASEALPQHLPARLRPATWRTALCAGRWRERGDGWWDPYVLLDLYQRRVGWVPVGQFRVRGIRRHVVHTPVAIERADRLWAQGIVPAAFAHGDDAMPDPRSDDRARERLAAVIEHADNVAVGDPAGLSVRWIDPDRLPAAHFILLVQARLIQLGVQPILRVGCQEVEREPRRKRASQPFRGRNPCGMPRAVFVAKPRDGLGVDLDLSRRRAERAIGRIGPRIRVSHDPVRIHGDRELDIPLPPKRVKVRQRDRLRLVPLVRHIGARLHLLLGGAVELAEPRHLILALRVLGINAQPLGEGRADVKIVS